MPPADGYPHVAALVDHISAVDDSANFALAVDLMIEAIRARPAGAGPAATPRRAAVPGIENRLDVAGDGADTPDMDSATVSRRLSTAELEAALPQVRRSPRGSGTLELLVRRPAVDERELLARGELDLSEGLVGDSWRRRPCSRTPDRSPHPDMQLNVINSRFVELIAGADRRAWALAGDQLYVDLDLAHEALPTGTRLAIGDVAVIQVTDQPHTGCAKFAARFGRDAHQLVWAEAGRALRLRGLNARVVVAGKVRAGDAVRVIAPE